jgi:hypothetical protein
MIAIIEPAEHPIAIHSRRQTHFVRNVAVAIGDRTRAAIRAMNEQLERRFAEFAGVPYHDPLDLEQWQLLWETEPVMSHERTSLSGSLAAIQTHGNDP